MKFTEWLKIKETGTFAGVAVPGTGGLQTTGMIAGVPKKLFGGHEKFVRRKFPVEKGLAGPLHTLPINGK
jgi:hypothetical protein